MRVLALIFLASCASAPAGDFTPFDEGRTWDYVLQEQGYQSYRLRCRVFGSDVRSLPDIEGPVEFVFVYGRVNDEEGERTKSIYAMAPDGAREFYFGGGSWSMQHDPPIALARDAAWTGTLSINREPRKASGRVRTRVEGARLVATTTYDGSPIVITRWFERDVGMVRMSVRGTKNGFDLRLN